MIRHLAPIGFAFLMSHAFALSVARAAPLDVRHLPSETAAIIHFDVEAFRKTSLYPVVSKLPLFNAHDAKDPAGARADALQALGERTMATCNSVSIWIAPKQNTADKDHDGAVLVEFPRGSKLASDLLGSLGKLGKTTKIGADQLTVAIDKDVYQVAVVDNVFVFTDKVADLTKTVAVLQGKATALTAKALPAGATGQGMFFIAALGGSLLHDIKQAAGSTLLKTDMTSLVIDFAQVGGDLRGRASAELTTADDAQKVKTVLDGVVALASLSDDLKPFQPIEHYLKVAVSGTSVSIVVTVPAAEIVKFIATH